MNLQQLEYFKIIAETKNFTTASEILSVTQPALSKAISKLEEELDVKLFQREGRNIKITEYGDVFLKYAKGALSEVEKGKLKLKEMKNNSDTIISISSTACIGAIFIPFLISGFFNNNSKVKFNIDNQNTDSKKVIIHSSIILDGGVGVGRVTKPGLSQKVGEAAINPVPKAMILREAEEAAQEYDYEGYLKITISVPEGEEISKKTFNPRLGIMGGISILGTSGIVEPMSERALIASIQVEMKQHFFQGENYILVTPGNYGADYLREHMTIPFENNIKCSNYVGETIDMAIDMGVKGILFVAHIGKFVKVAAGIMNTHSHCADGRMEVLCASAIRAGGTLECAREILEAGTTDEALAVIDRYGILKQTMAIVMEKIQFYLDHRSYEQILLGAVVFSNVYGLLGQTRDALKLMEAIQEQADAGADKL